MARNTYIIDITDLNQVWDNFEKETRYAIRKCEKIVCKTEDISDFDKMHRQTRPDRKIGTAYILDLWQSRKPFIAIYTTGTAMAMVSWRFRYGYKRGYYLLAARKSGNKDGSPSKILWQVMIDMNKVGIKKFDMCGCNVESIALFKRGFGGKKVRQIKPCLTY